MRKRLLILGIFMIVVGLIYTFQNDIKEETISRYGSTGQEVKNIQTKLKNWGYYNGSVDGIYGS